ncbi:hypothetical protein [Schlesneria paludicola]|uniref:hypothetical protein n=1 Tax=Schlesneria paludicola TaxID=360056 RepID=UPI00058BE308|nr:hypothetical protein [Schlesneria paludicola]
MSERITRAFVRDIVQSAVVPGNRVVRSTELAHVGGRHASHNETASIELVKENDIVRAIDVTCACGQKMRIWCSYENPSEIHSTAETP